MESPQRRLPVLAVDVDHTLAKLNESVLEWHNAEHSAASIDTRDSTIPGYFATPAHAEAAEQRLAFFASTHFATSDIAVVDSARDVLASLRRYFFVVAVSDRPQPAEKHTRAWLDTHFAGVVDKLVVVTDAAHKQALYANLHVQVAISADAAELAALAAAAHVPHALVVHATPAPASAMDTVSLTQVASWSNATEAIERIVAALALSSLAHVRAGPKLAKFTDNVVSISTRKSPAFYVGIIRTKFMTYKQARVRIRAADATIATAIQVAETLQRQHCATPIKIATYASVRRGRKDVARVSSCVPLIEIEMQRSVGAESA